MDIPNQGQPQSGERGDSAGTGAHLHDACHLHESCSHGDLAEHHPASDAICVDGVSFSYRSGGLARSGKGIGRADRGGAVGDASASDQWVLRDITLHVERGCNLGIIGPNGAGKTTLLKIILGLLGGYSGKVSIMGMSPERACRRGDVIGYVPQRHQAEWRIPITARQVVLMGLAGKTGLLRWYTKADRDYADDLLERVGMAGQAGDPIGSLSGGQQQRLFIARALVARPKVLLLDEPLSGIDEAGQIRVAQMIHDLHESLGLTVVMVSHDIRAIAAGCNRVACLRQRIHYHDAPEGLTPGVLNEVFAHEIAPAFEKWVTPSASRAGQRQDGPGWV